jgi:hypothetical protein
MSAAWLFVFGLITEKLWRLDEMQREMKICEIFGLDRNELGRQPTTTPQSVNVGMVKLRH